MDADEAIETDDYYHRNVEEQRRFIRMKRDRNANRLRIVQEEFRNMLPQGTTFDETVGKGFFTHVGENGKTLAKNEFLGRLAIRFPWTKKPFIVRYDDYGDSKDVLLISLYRRAIRLVENEIKAQHVREHDQRFKSAVNSAQAEMRRLDPNFASTSTPTHASTCDNDDESGIVVDEEAQLEALLNADSKEFQVSMKKAEQKQAKEAEEEKRRQARATKKANTMRK